MKLSEIIKVAENHGLKIKEIKGNTDVEVGSLEYDSRKVKDGSAFVCLKGAKFDGHAYATDVCMKGASVLFAQDKIDESQATVVYVENTRLALAYISAAFYGNPAEKLYVIGITGTKGKTTTAHMVKSILEAAGKKTGMIGTVGAFAGNKKVDTVNTTPESAELHRLFAWMLSEGCTHVVMEVSSQAYKVGRCEGISFDTAAFLNITPDHIGDGEHADFEEYFSCKSMLFDHSKSAVVNMDADRWQEAVKGVNGNYKTFSVKQNADLSAHDIKNTWEPDMLGLTFVTEGEINEEFHLGIAGEFNVENAMAAILLAKEAGVSNEAIKSGLKNVSVKGRMQLMTCALSKTTLLIDYAHNAVSMEELLKTLREYNPKRLIVMFGGGGNRPKARRHDMGYMAGKYADFILITSDNSRMEAVDDINKDILTGVTEFDTKYEIINDRKKAIYYLLDNCRKDDIVVLAGKGHEEYQDIMGVKYHFSEQEIVEEYMKEHAVQ